MDEFKWPEASVESWSISNPQEEQNLLGESAWQASDYTGARFHGSKDAVTTEIAKVIMLELEATCQKINQQQLDRLIDLSFRSFITLAERLKDSGHDSIIPQDFDELMEKLIRKHVSHHKLVSIRLEIGDHLTRARPRPERSPPQTPFAPPEPSSAPPRLPPFPPRPPPAPPGPFPGD